MTHILHSNFVKNVFTMMTGNISAQAIAFLCAPIISRIYAPEAFGAMTLIWSIVGISVLIATMRYEQAIVIEENDENAFNILLLCILISLVTCLLIVIILFFFEESLANIFKLEYDDHLMWFIPIGIFATSILHSYTFFYTRKKRFKSLASFRVSQTLVSQFVKIVLGILIGSYAGVLLFGNVAGLIFPAIIMTAAIIKNNSFNKIRKALIFSKLKNLFLKYKHFPTYHVPTGLLNQFSTRFIIFAFAAFFNPEVVGLYGFMNHIARQPLNLVSQSLNKVFLKELSDAKNKRQSLKKHFLKTTGGLALLGFLPFLTLGVFGKPLFSWIFGNNWAEAGLYAQCMSPFFFMLFINSPATQLFIVLQKLRFIFFFNLFNSGSRIGIILGLCFLSMNPHIVLIFVSLSGVIFNTFYIIIAFKNV